MKKARWFLLLLPVPALFCAAFSAPKQRPEDVLRQFSTQQSDFIGTADCAQEHLRILKAWQKTKRWPYGIERFLDNGRKSYIPTRPLLLFMSWYAGTNYTVEWDVDTGAALGYFTISSGMGPYGDAVHYLSQIEMKRLHKLVHRFPTCVAPTPTFRNAFFVSYRDGDSWQARVYSRRSLPLPVRQLLKLRTLRGQLKGLPKGFQPDLAL